VSQKEVYRDTGGLTVSVT